MWAQVTGPCDKFMCACSDNYYNASYGHVEAVLSADGIYHVENVNEIR